MEGDKEGLYSAQPVCSGDVNGCQGTGSEVKEMRYSGSEEGKK